MKLCFIDSTGLRYTGDTLLRRGLGGSESAIIYMSRELAKLGFDVTVYNRCEKEGVFDGVTYIDLSKVRENQTAYDILISSRSVLPLAPQEYGVEIWNVHSVDIGPYEVIAPQAKHKVVWAHDTFIEGEGYLEPVLVSGVVDELFLLSDWHTHYISQSDHWGTQKRDYAVLKSKIFNTRNGMCAYLPAPEGYLHKDKDLFVYNSSAGKGLVTLVKEVWPKVKQQIPSAKLVVIGGYYHGIKDVVKDDDGERIWKELQTETATKLDISFTGVITQKQVDEVLINASFLIYPPEFPETYGISTLEALYYGVIPITSVYGALEQTAIDDLSFKLPYPVLPGDTNQIRKFVNLVVQTYQDTYRCDQKRQAAEAVREISSWETVAKQWKAHFYRKFNLLIPKAETEEVRQITSIVNRLFGTRHINPEDRLEYFPTKEERRLVIISPTWNAEDYIERCIKSVAAQLYENYIHIIIDDVSADKTAAIAEQIVNNLPDSLRSKFLVVKNVKRVGALQNQMTAINQFTEADDIIVLLDGDDSLYNDPDIFNYINEQYPSNEMTYGSCWSMTDGLALIGQEYPEKVRLNKTYRQYRPFPWGIPHTHLRTFDRDLYLRADHNKLLDDDGVPYGPAGDSALMYMLLEEADPYRIKAVKRLMVNYNDMNPLNDYKANTEEQNRNTQKIAGTVPTKTPTAPPESPVVKTRILIGTPTAKYIESETFGSIYNLSVPEHVGTWFECFYGYNIAQIRNLMADYAINHGFDYMLWVDSDIILPRDTLEKMLASGKDIISGLYVQRLPDKTIPEVYIWRGNRLVNADVAELTGEDLISVWGVGFGCVLTKTNVLRDIGYPQFEYKNSLDHANTVSEDVDFCLKARRKGYDIFLDPTIQCKHIGTRIHEVKHV